jgi:uncharacterized protein YjiS (DUF1127 family)
MVRELTPPIAAVQGEAVSPAAALRDLAYALARPVRRWRRHRVMVAKLSQLDLPLLDDIGVPAWEIDAFARRVVDNKLPARGTAYGALVSFVRATRRNAQLARQRRVLIADLRSLDDRLLKDIGVARYEIPSVVESLLAPWSELYSGGVATSGARPSLTAVETPHTPAGTANDNMLLKAS